MNKVDRVLMYVDRDFKREIKKSAAECDLTMEQLTRELSKEVNLVTGKIKGRTYLNKKLW